MDKDDVVEALRSRWETARDAFFGTGNGDRPRTGDSMEEGPALTPTLVSILRRLGYIYVSTAIHRTAVSAGSENEGEMDREWFRHTGMFREMRFAAICQGVVYRGWISVTDKREGKRRGKASNLADDPGNGGRRCDRRWTNANRLPNPLFYAFPVRAVGRVDSLVQVCAPGSTSRSPLPSTHLTAISSLQRPRPRPAPRWHAQPPTRELHALSVTKPSMPSTHPSAKARRGSKKSQAARLPCVIHISHQRASDSPPLLPEVEAGRTNRESSANAIHSLPTHVFAKISHQAESISQLRREANQWRDQARNWQEHFLRVEQEKCGLTTRMEELVSEGLQVHDLSFSFLPSLHGVRLFPPLSTHVLYQIA